MTEAGSAADLYWESTNSERPHYPETPKVEIFRYFINSRHKRSLRDYWELHRWSINNVADFWNAAWDFTGILGERDPNKAVYDPSVPMDQFQKWFPESKMNFAENLLLSHPNARSASKLAVVSCAEPPTGGNSPRILSEMTYADLYDQVNELSSKLRSIGVKPGERVSSFAATSAEMVVAFLASAAIGCPYSCAPVEFGLEAVLDRFTQTKPSVLFSIDSTSYGGKQISVLPLLAEICKRLSGSLKHIVILGHHQKGRHVQITSIKDFQNRLNLPIAVSTWNEFLAGGSKIKVFSSGTTGKPKAIVHSSGAQLLTRKFLLNVHFNVDHRDTMLQFATLGWIAYNTSVTALSAGVTLLMYDGSPLKPRSVLWELVEKYKATALGVSPSYFGAMSNAKYHVSKFHDVRSLKLLFLTGAPITEKTYNYLDTMVKPEKIFLFNSIGATGKIFFLYMRNVCGNSILFETSERIPQWLYTDGKKFVYSWQTAVPTLPLYRSEVQCPTLGMHIESLDDDGNPVRDEPGSMCVMKPFPNQPLGFLNDPENKRFHESYYENFRNVICWAQQDSLMINSKTGGMVMLGRTDGVLNPNGVRFGSADIYNVVNTLPEYFLDSICVGQKDGDTERVCLFLQMQPGVKFTPDIEEKLRLQIQRSLSRRHVPEVMMTIPEIPLTTNGKKVETQVKKVLAGKKAIEVGGSGLENPRALEWFERQTQLRRPSKL